jgi:hypothetical protein
MPAPWNINLERISVAGMTNAAASSLPNEKHITQHMQTCNAKLLWQSQYSSWLCEMHAARSILEK